MTASAPSNDGRSPKIHPHDNLKKKYNKTTIPKYYNNNDIVLLPSLVTTHISKDILMKRMDMMSVWRKCMLFIGYEKHQSESMSVDVLRGWNFDLDEALAKSNHSNTNLSISNINNSNINNNKSKSNSLNQKGRKKVNSTGKIRGANPVVSPSKSTDHSRGLTENLSNSMSILGWKPSPLRLSSQWNSEPESDPDFDSTDDDNDDNDDGYSLNATRSTVRIICQQRLYSQTDQFSKETFIQLVKSMENFLYSYMNNQGDIILPSESQLGRNNLYFYKKWGFVLPSLSPIKKNGKYIEKFIIWNNEESTMKAVENATNMLIAAKMELGLSIHTSDSSSSNLLSEISSLSSFVSTI